MISESRSDSASPALRGFCRTSCGCVSGQQGFCAICVVTFYVFAGGRAVGPQPPAACEMGQRLYSCEPSHRSAPEPITFPGQPSGQLSQYKELSRNSDKLGPDMLWPQFQFLWGRDAAHPARLLELDFRASFFKLLLDFFGFLFRSAFFHGLATSFDQVLGFFQAQTGDAANFF